MLRLEMLSGLNLREKNSLLLIAEIKKRYRQAKVIRLIDDYNVKHKSSTTREFLQRNQKIKLIF